MEAMEQVPRSRWWFFTPIIAVVGVLGACVLDVWMWWWALDRLDDGCLDAECGDALMGSDPRLALTPFLWLATVVAWIAWPRAAFAGRLTRGKGGLWLLIAVALQMITVLMLGSTLWFRDEDPHHD